jgi:hypothetical protein
VSKVPVRRVRYGKAVTRVMLEHYDEKFKGKKDSFIKCAQSLRDILPETFSDVENYHVMHAVQARDKPKNGFGCHTVLLSSLGPNRCA